jgi:hypothetical protein
MILNIVIFNTVIYPFTSFILLTGSVCLFVLPGPFNVRIHFYFTLFIFTMLSFVKEEILEVTKSNIGQ